MISKIQYQHDLEPNSNCQLQNEDQQTDDICLQGCSNRLHPSFREQEVSSEEFVVMFIF